MTKWPQEYSTELVIGNPISNIGIATLWSEKKPVVDCLDPSSYCIIANFSDRYYAIEPMIRNCLANPLIRYIIVLGDDRSGSLKVLRNFFNEGVKEHTIKGTDVTISKEIPIGDLEMFRREVKLIDLTDQIKSTDNFHEKVDILKEAMDKCDKLSPYLEPKTFPRPEILTEQFPSEKGSLLVRSETVADSWIEMLHILLTYGEFTKMSVNDEAPIRECINLISVVENEDVEQLQVPTYLKYSRTDIEAYLQLFCYENVTTDNAYTYGNRLRLDQGDQINDIITLLKEDKLSKRAYASTWIRGDMFKAISPCLISIQVTVQEDKLYITAYIRSSDVFKSWPLNAFSIRHIQNLIAKKLDLPLGTMTIISNSAQLYFDDWEEAKEIVKNNYNKYNKFSDPRGYFIISVEDNEIFVKHANICGRILREFTGDSEKKISDYLNISSGPIDPFHISYLTRELLKAELCLKFGVEYIQDVDLDKLLINKLNK